MSSGKDRLLVGESNEPKSSFSSNSRYKQQECTLPVKRGGVRGERLKNGR